MENAVPISTGTETISTKTATGSTTTTGLQNVAVVPAEALTVTSERELVEQREQVAVAVANKYVTTEHVRNTVPTVKETAVLDRQLIPESEKDAHSAEIREEHREMPLVQDRVVATKETVPVEKVKLTKEVERVDVSTDKELSSYVSTEGVNVGTKTLDNSLVTEQTRMSAMPVTSSSSSATTTTNYPVSSSSTTTTNMPMTSNVTTSNTNMQAMNNNTNTTHGTIRNPL